jgi:hypothetical protein
VKKNRWYNQRLEHTIEVYEKYIRYILNTGEFFSRLVMPPLSANRVAGAVTLARPIYFGTEATPLSFSERRKGKKKEWLLQF